MEANGVVQSCTILLMRERAIVRGQSSIERGLRGVSDRRGVSESETRERARRERESMSDGVAIVRERERFGVTRRVTGRFG